MDEIPARLSDEDVEERLTYLDGVLGRVEVMPEPHRQVASDALAGLTEIYGEALSRVLAAADADMAARVSDDPLVGHLLMLHGLHPVPPEQRVEQAINEIHELLGNPASVQLSGIEAGVARVSVTAAGCGSRGISAAVRDVVLGAAPDLVAVETEDSVPGATAFIPVDSLRRQPSRIQHR